MTNEHIKNIRQGLAANLRSLEDCQVSAYLLDNPTGPTLQVAGFEGIDYAQSYGPTTLLEVVVEGATPLGGGTRGAYERFDEWILGDGTVWDAIEADQTLTSRLRDNGSVLENQDPVADSVAVQEFRGYRRSRLASGVEVLLGDWLVQVLTSGE
jgi:hypothetical protein